MNKIIAIKTGNQVNFKKSGTGSKSTYVNIPYVQFLEPLGITQDDNKISICLLEDDNGDKKIVISKNK